MLLSHLFFKDFSVKSVPNDSDGSLHRQDLSWGWTPLESEYLLTTKYSMVYMEKEAWPEKKDLLEEQERAV